MIRASAGTAACMGLSGSRMDAYPTTAYLLSGKQCLMGCAFCPQGTAGNNYLKRLGRVTWPEFTWEEVEEGLSKQAEKNRFRRICLQSVRHAAGIGPLLEAVTRIKSASSLPLSLSAWIESEKEAAALFAAGVERISVSLDAVDPGVYKKIKGGSLEKRLKLLLRCANKYPGQMTTHLICGLGETEAELLSLIDRLHQAGITVALFAFIPLKGTNLEGEKPPYIGSYRRVQAGIYLLREKRVDFSSFSFKNGRLKSFGLPKSELERALAAGEAFQTGGCPDCNRPYYNERPGGVIYNYPRGLTSLEIEEALKTLFETLPEQVS